MQFGDLLHLSNTCTVDNLLMLCYYLMKNKNGDWHSSLYESSRYECYREFKSLPEPESYLYNLSHKHLRNVFTRLRLGLNDLAINRGRYASIVKTQRLCPFCSAVENELHFVFLCPVYNDLRNKYFPQWLHSNNRVNTLHSLLSCKSSSLQYKVALFVYHALLLRRDSM